MDRDLDDTVIRPARALAEPPDNDDTIVRMRRNIVAGRPRSPEPVQPAPAYSFVINSHEPIGLERPAYVGRKPSAPRIAMGTIPRLVRVPSPLGEVSGTHLELRQEGTMVIATDLRSTNGTRVRLPGSTTTRLRQGESIVVTPGSIIEIGDGNVIEIHSLRRTYPSDAQLGETHS